MYNPKVGICIPAYNGGKFIKRALESTLGQTYRNIEVVITDDGSNDDTEAVVMSYAKKDSRIIFFKNKMSLGVMANYFRAFELSGGEFIQALGQDDWLSENYIEEALNCFKGDSSIGAVFTKVLGVELSSEKLRQNVEVSFKQGYYPVKYVARNIYKSAWGSISFSTFWRREDAVAASKFVLEVCKDQNYGNLYAKGFATDWAFALKAISRYDQVYFLNNVAYMKLGHERNAGKSFGFRNDRALDIVKSREIIIDCLEHAYQGNLKDLFPLARVGIVTQAINEIIFNFIKARLNRDFFAGFKHASLNNLFKKLGFWQKVSILLLVPYLSLLRILKFLFMMKN